LVFEKGKGEDKDGEKRGKNKEIERRDENTYGETKQILNACCLTLSYLSKF